MMSRVKMMEEPRMTIEIEKKAAMIGTDVDVGGVMSATCKESCDNFIIFPFLCGNSCHSQEDGHGQQISGF
jgi:hypothetical protein